MNSKAAWSDTADLERPDVASLDEIIVTAQKRSENLQSTPMAVTPLSADDLANKGISNLLQLNAAVPGLSIDSNLNESVAFLRGIGPEINFPQNGSAVPFQSDGADVQREALATGLFDIGQIEVLRGPQGTLYGHNALGGVINIMTNRPTDKLEGAVEVESGNYSLQRASGMLNVPVASNFFVRAAFQTVSRDGYLSNGAGALHTEAARVEALYTPTDNFDLLIVAAIGHQSGIPADPVPKTCGYPLPANLGEPVNCGTTPHNAGLIDSNHPWNDDTPTAGAFLSEHNWSVSANANWRFGDDLTLTFIPAVSQVKNAQDWYNGSNTNINEFLDPKQHTEELRLSNSADNKSGNWRWIVGLYDFGSTTEFIGKIHPSTMQTGDYPTVGPGEEFFPPIPTAYFAFSENDVKLTSDAVFGQASYSFTDRLRVTAGARYSKDKESGITGAGATGAPFFPPVELVSHDVKGDRADWKVGAEFDLTDRSLLYANIQTGYLAGGFSLPAQADGNYAPETLTAYSIGSKNRFFDNRLEINGEGFYYDYKGYQLAFNNAVTGQQTIYNANLVHIYGADLSVQFRLTAADKFDATVALLHTEIIDFVTPQPTFGDEAGGTLLVAAGTSLAGYQLELSPKVAASIGYEHLWTLPGGATLAARVDDHHESSHYGDLFLSQAGYSPAFDKTNVTLNFTSSDAKWHAGLYVYNIQNAYSFTLDTAPLGSAFIQPPRTFGAKLGLNF